MSKYCIIFTMLIIAFLSITGESSEAFGSDAFDIFNEAEKIAENSAFVSYSRAGVPLGYLLLIRKNKEICAIRFTEYNRGRDAKPPTVTNTGEETLYAEYDWFYQEDGSSDFSNLNLKSGHEKLTRKPLTGIGRLSFQTGTTFIKCGPLRLQWDYPNQVSFHSKPTPCDEGIEIAPTKWRNIEDIKISDTQLKWYRYDKEEKRKAIYIPFNGK